MKTVGFVGLGTMGRPMALNLLKKGYRLTVYNRSAGKMHEFAQLGADIASRPADVAAAVDVLFTNVSDDAALQDVMYGEGGILEGVRPGMTVIDCSTVSPDLSRRVAQDLAGRSADFLDAPVTGSKPAAESGTLVFMIGGNKDAFEEHRDLFETLGSKTVFLGPNGSGSYAKLAHNTMVGINAVGLMEGLALATKSGLDPDQFLDIVKAGSANSRQAELKGPKIVARDFSNQFSVKLMLKDLLLASGVAASYKLPLPMLSSAANVFQMGLAKGLGDDDLSAVMLCYEDWMQQQIVRDETSATAETQHAVWERRRSPRVNLGVQLQLSVYQWEHEGSFSGQTIEGTLNDLSDSGLQIASKFPLAQDMFIVIHFPQEADLPPIIGKIIRIHVDVAEFRYGCMLSGLPPHTRLRLESYIARLLENGR